MTLSSNLDRGGGLNYLLDIHDQSDHWLHQGLGDCHLPFMVPILLVCGVLLFQTCGNRDEELLWLACLQLLQVRGECNQGLALQRCAEDQAMVDDWEQEGSHSQHPDQRYRCFRLRFLAVPLPGCRTCEHNHFNIHSLQHGKGLILSRW